MIKFLFAICGFFFWPLIYGQLPVGSWSDHLRYNTASSIAVGSEEVFTSTGASLLVYNKKFNELKKMSKVNGLSETGISAIAWSEENNILIIAYKNTNIDLVKKNTVYNITDILNTYIPGNKRINRIRVSGRNAYLATGFGIIIIDLVKMEIHDTWRPGPDSENNEVFDIAFGNSLVYAATNLGVWYGDISDPGLAYSGNWNRLNDLPGPDSKSTLLMFSGNVLYVNVSSPYDNADRVYAIGSGTTLFSFMDGVFNSSIDPAFNGFTITSPGMLRYFKSDGTSLLTISSYGWGSPNLSEGVIEKDYIWLADINYGLIMVYKTSDFINLTLTGPVSNKVANITSSSGKTIICGGGTDNLWNGLKRPLMVSIHENNQFANLISEKATDALRSCIDPDNSNHFFISTWGKGLMEYNNNKLVKQYDNTNSPLEADESGVKICGLALDNEKNLWITQTGVAGSLKIFKSNGTWIIHPAVIDAPVKGDIISTMTGQKWIVLPEGYGVFIIDDNNTPDQTGDDKSKKLTVTDTDGNIFNSVFSIAEDLDGNIWLGTDHGPVVYYTPVRVFEEDIRGYRIKVPRDDGSGLADYLLGTETITTISVDGANRKWLGTKSSGAYLISAEGTEMLRNYNEKNSPIFSDSIASVTVDNKTGEVWFGTSEGLLSLRETATSGSEEFIKVYSFPNPVRENYNGNVTITGLIRDTQVKITDISGNLVFETMSEGGQATWDLTTYNGRRVATGVYLIFCANNDGTRSCVTKILVIGR